ncbi:MAG: VWA domain-containing protein [Bacteroidia bacterium]|nr:VWA domain-containing protein [Bacteroidia bacterium]
MFISFIFSFHTEISAQKNKITRILFIFDVSRSMTGMIGQQTKMDKAKALFFNLIDSLAADKNNRFALRAFGHTVKYPPGNCNDTKLLVPFSSVQNIQKIKSFIQSFKPTGITPIEHSLTQSAGDFPDNKQTNVIILITDGIEECGGDPCKAKAFLASKGIELRPFIIGIGLTPEQIKAYDCVGKFIDSEKNNLIQDIRQTIHEFQNLKTTFQVNLLNSKNIPEETNTNMTFWDSAMTKYSFNYIHTLNSASVPDTLQLPLRKTKVQVHTIPPAFSPYTEIISGKHTIIPVSVPQGSLIIRRPDGMFNQNDQLKFIVRHRAGKNTLHVQPVNTMEKYIVGSYDLEILTLPRIYMYDVKVEEKKLNSITIPNDGQLIVKTLDAGDGCIMQVTENGPEWVVNLSGKNYQEFYLQPGKYVLAWRSKKLKSSIYTIEKKFTILPDRSITIELYKQ